MFNITQPKTSIARERYPIRKSRLQPPLNAHEYITKTCKYRLPVFLNSINNCSGRTRQHSRIDCGSLLRSDQYNKIQ